MTKYDYERAAADKVLGWFWDYANNGKAIGFLCEITDAYFTRACFDNFRCREKWNHFEFYDPEVAKLYEIKEPEYIKFDSAEELARSEFAGKMVKCKNKDDVAFRLFGLIDIKGGFSCQWWFENYETLDGKPIGKLREVQ